MTLTVENLQRIRRIELRTRRLVDDSFAGAYHATFKGRGIAFDTVRPYVPGDDVRDIDWNVTARTSEPHVKSYIEDRELTVMLALDASASTDFGSVNRQKRTLAAEVGAVLALSAITNNDKVGLLIFSDRVESYIAPRKGRNHVLRVIRDLLAAKPTGRFTDLALALRTINQGLKRRAIVFLISDFLVSHQEYDRELLAASRRHDMVAIVLSDPLEKQWPAAGLVGLRDTETNAISWVDSSSQQWRGKFATRARRYEQARNAALARARVDRIDVSVDSDHIYALTSFFRQRAQRLRS